MAGTQSPSVASSSKRFVNAASGSLSRRSMAGKASKSSTGRWLLPVLLEFSSVILNIGFAGDDSPKTSIILHPQLQEANHGDHKLTSKQYYTLLYPLIEEALGRLGVSMADNVATSSANRAVMVVTTDLCTTCGWKEALSNVLNQLGVTRVCLKDGLGLLPTVVPHMEHLLVIHVSHNTSRCLAQAHGLPLPFTEFTIPVGYRTVVVDDPDLLETQWTDKMSEYFLHPLGDLSLVVAILRTLQACPRDVRSIVVENIMFAGEGVLFIPSLAVRVMRQVKAILEERENDIINPDYPQPQSDDATTTITIEKWSELRVLAPKLNSIVRPACRPDRLVWAASSLWTKGWHQRDPDAPAFDYQRPQSCSME